MLQRRVLLADDEPQVRSLIKAFLAAARFDVIEAGDGVEAMEAIDGAGGSFDLLITDIQMPRMSGIVLARSLASAFPAIPVLLISGYSPEPDYAGIAGAPRRAFLGKPFSPQALLQKVAFLLPAEPEVSCAAGS
jgi:two-component system, cell cycle sensor histidine kinase and response regulator CckA